MQRGTLVMAAFLVLILCIGQTAMAQTEWQVRQTLKFDSEPVDMLVTNRSGRVYVLNDQGEILIYAFNGQIKGKIDVGPDVVAIEPGPNEDLLFLLRSKNKTIQSITIRLKEEIDVNGSPYKGAVDAPVTIAVFSDFQ